MMKRISSALFLSLILFFGCHQAKEDNKQNKDRLPTDIVNNPATASADSTKNQDKLPVFHFEVEKHDFGTIMQGEKVSYGFKFTNTGKTDLLINDAHGSCGCTIPSYSKTPIPPGGQGVIDVTFNSEGKSGMQHKQVTVIANTIPNTKVLVITGEVIEPKKR